MAGQNNNEVQITFKAFNSNFNKSIKEMNGETATLTQQMKLQQEQMKHTSTETERLEAKVGSLQQIYQVAQRKTQEAANALERAKQIWGEQSVEVGKLEAQLRRQQIAEQQAANAITETQTALQRAQQAQTNQAKSLQDLNNILQVSGRSLESFSDLLGQDLTRAIQNGTASSAQLRRAFQQIAGTTQDTSVNIDQVRQVLSRLQSGDNVETVRRELQELNNTTITTTDRIKSLQQTMKLQEEQMKHSASESQKLEAKLRNLQSIHGAMRSETQELAQKLQQARTAYGQSSTAAQALEEQLQRSRLAQEQMANSITETRQAISTQEKAFTQLRSLLTVTSNSVDDFANVLGQDLVTAINSGRANASELERAFQQIGRASQGSSTDIEALRNIISRLDGSNIDDIRRDVEELSNSADEATQQIGALEAGLGALGGAFAGAGIAEVLKSALDVSDLNNKIDIVIDVPEESKAKVRQAIADVQKYGVEGEEALEGIRRQWALNKDASDEANTRIAEGAASITKAYSRVDFVELIQETNEIAGELGIADEEALNLVNDLLKIGFPDEQIDTIAEYGQQLKRAGYEANEIKGIMASAVATDSWNIDNLLDGLKEGRILAAEMGNGLSDTFKESIASVTNNTKRMTDEQISSLEDTLSDQEEALSKSLDTQYKAADDAYSDQEDALKDSLDVQYETVEKNYDRQEKELDKSLEAELKAYERMADKKIALIDKEYTERLKLIDEEKYNAIKAVEDEIKSIENLMDSEDRATQQAENDKKRAELQKNINYSKTNLQRRMAEQALADFEADLQSQRVKEERKQNIDSLKEQKDEIKDLYDGKKDEIKSEYDLAKEKAKESIDIEKDSIRQRQQLEKESFRERKTAYLNNVRESHTAELDAYREMNNSKLEQMKEMQEQELEQVQKVNDTKVDAAKNPPDSALFKQTVAQLESWGDAVAKGGEEGSQAFEGMVRWLDGIEDATLRNTVGVQLFGTKWEDQGENIVDTILGVDDATKELAETQTTINDNVDKMNTENALVKFNEAINNAKIALAPLLTVIADIIFKISDWAAKNPTLTSSIFAIMSVIGILAGALASLAPIIFTITSLFGAGTAGGGFLAILSKIGPFLLNLGTKILPLLGGAFAFLTGPIGLVITALTIAIPLIIKNWDSILEFFKNLFKKIIDLFKASIDGISEFFKNWGPTILNILKTGPIGYLVRFFKDNWEAIWTSTKSIFGRVKDAITDPIDKARDAVKNSIDKIKSFFNFKFEWPDLKVPHFQIKKGSLNPLKWFSEGFPEIDIEWFAKGGIMNGATVFGGSGNTAFVGGEAGKEAILPLNERVLGSIGRAIFAASGGTESNSVVHNYERMLEGATLIIREEADVKKVARELYDLQQVDRRGR